MPEGVGYGPQFTASTGLSLNYVGKHAYAHSGELTVTNGANTTMLEFTTGKEYIVSKVSFATGDADISGGKIIGYQISFNDNVIFSTLTESDSDGTMVYDGSCFPQTVLIPPFTLVKVEGFTTDTDNLKCYTILNGRVHK